MKVRPLLPFFIFLVVFEVLVSQVRAQSAKGSISGKVLSTTEQALAGATISLKEYPVSTSAGEDGAFSFKGLPAGSYTLLVRFQGYKSAEQSVDVKADQDNPVMIQLEPGGYALDEVVVSTQKRTQNSVEVPVAISALSGVTLERLNIRQMDEFSAFVPGMQVQLQSPNNPGYVIRGITSDDGDSRSQPRISLFQDGVSISRSRASAVELFDLERVEVVKGPQGTLFGRGAEIGALHIIQNKAQPFLSGGVNAGYGDYQQRMVNGFINTPLVKDKLANRLALDYEGRDGFIRNLSGGRLNGKEVFAARNSTRLWGGSNTVADLILNYQYDNYPGTSFKSERFAPAGGDTDPNSFADLEQGKDLYIKRHVGGATLLIDHTLNDRWKLSSISGFRKFKADESFDADGTAAPILWVSEIAKGDQLSQELRFNYTDHKQFTGFVGASYFYENSSQEVPMRINEQSLYPAYIAPLMKAQVEGQIGQLGTALGLPESTVAALAAQAGQLFVTPPAMVDGAPQLVSNLPNLQPFALGLISQLLGTPLPPTLTWDQLLASGMLPPGTLPDQVIGLVSALNGGPINALHTESSTNYGRNQAIDLFADGTWDLTPDFKLTAGVRGTYENQRGGYFSAASAQPSVFAMIVNNGSPNLLNTVSDGKIYATKDYFSYVGRLVLNYLFNQNNFYVSASRGRRPGVVSILPSETVFLAPEIVWSYEAGLKGLLANGQLNYDLAAYYYDWNHFQTISLQTVDGEIAPRLLAEDAGKAHTFGVEASLRYAIGRSASVFGNYSYIDGKFNDTDEHGQEQEYAGHRFRLTPKHSFALGVDALIPTGKTSSIYLRPSYTYKSQVYFEDSNRADLSQDGYGLANFSAGYRFRIQKLNYELGVFGKNVLDEKYIIDAGNSGDTIGFPTYIGGSRSLLGIQASLKF